MVSLGHPLWGVPKFICSFTSPPWAMVLLAWHMESHIGGHCFTHEGWGFYEYATVLNTFVTCEQATRWLGVGRCLIHDLGSLCADQTELVGWERLFAVIRVSWLRQKEVIFKGTMALTNGVVHDVEGFVSCWFGREWRTRMWRFKITPTLLVLHVKSY